jgi:predicted metal-dependent phosphoesterase TrpH
MKLDLHVHSIYSYDSFLRPELLIKIAKKRNLDGIAVTDHNTIKGGLRTRAIAPKGFLVIPGAEIKTEKGEIIGLFIEEEITSRLFDEVKKEIMAQEGITLLPHPYRNKYCDPERLMDSIDALEVLNARTSPSLNDKALRLAEKYSKPKIGGSDAHYRFEIGRVYTKIPGNDLLDRRDILKADVEIIGSEIPPYMRIMNKGMGKVVKQSRRIFKIPNETEI